MVKFCSNCGNQISEGSRFCEECGAALFTNPSNNAPMPLPTMEVEKSSSSDFKLDQTNPYSSPREVEKTSGSYTGLYIFLSLLLVVQIAAVVLWGRPGLLVKEREERLSTSKIVDGTAELSDMTVDFSSSDFSESKFENTKTSSKDIEEGAVSSAYDFAFSKLPEGAITLSTPISDDLSLAEDEKLYLDVAFYMIDETGEQVMVYDHIEASEQGGLISAQIVPEDYKELESNVYLDSSGYVKPAYSDKMRFNAQFKVKLVKRSQTERFNLIFDRSRIMATTIEDGEIQSLLSRMEQTYSKYEEFGFDMSRRTKWPMDIYVTTLKNSDATTATYGLYVSSWLGINYGYMNLSRLLFLNFDLESATSVFAHELMHYVQECYVSTQFKRLEWLDEATSVFFEKYFGGKGDHSARQYELFDGIYPKSDSAKAGYGRGSLISYWAHKGGWLEGKDVLSGKDKMEGLIDLYSTGGYLKESMWYEWINYEVGDPSEYAIDFFTKMMLNDETVWADIGLQTYILHQVIVGNIGKTDKDFSSKMNLEYTISKFSQGLMLNTDELITEDGQGHSVKVPAYGARVVALAMTDTEREKIENDGSLIISSKNGEEMVLIKALSLDVKTEKGASISSPDFLQMLSDKNRYLLLLVNTTNKEKDISFNLRMEVEEEKDEYALLSIDDVVGTYRETSYGEIVSGGETLNIGRDGKGFVLDGISFTYTSELNSGYGLSTVEEAGDIIDIEFSFKKTDGKIELFTYFTINEGFSMAGKEYIKVD